MASFKQTENGGTDSQPLGVPHLDLHYDFVLSVGLCWKQRPCLHLYPDLSLPSTQGHIKILLVAAGWISGGTTDSPGGIRLQSGGQHLPFSLHDRPASMFPLILTLVISAASSLDTAVGICFFKCQLSQQWNVSHCGFCLIWGNRCYFVDVVL